MKARVKATGEIVEVNECGQAFKDMGWDYMDMRGRCYRSEDLDFTDNTPFDYWTRLEHQAAIAAMQGILSNQNLYGSIIQMTQVSRVAIDYAQELVEKMKEKEERK